MMQFTMFHFIYGIILTFSRKIMQCQSDLNETWYLITMFNYFCKIYLLKYVQQGWHRLVNYLNEEGFLVSFSKILSALKSASDSLKGLEKSLLNKKPCRTLLTAMF